MWYVFWHDVWCLNKSMKMFEGKLDEFDPYKDTSICYKPMQRAELVAFLEQKGGWLCACLFACLLCHVIT
jgi:hypothetical protein